MPAPDLTFAVPTYRLREVGATVEQDREADAELLELRRLLA